MTAENYLENTFSETGFDIDNTIQKNLVIGAMKWYAMLKCEELLKIVAEKAEVEKTHISPVNNILSREVSKSLGFENTDVKVSTDSILNAVDLNEFIK